jgi:hypothetical protein
MRRTCHIGNSSSIKASAGARFYQPLDPGGIFGPADGQEARAKPADHITQQPCRHGVRIAKPVDKLAGDAVIGL